MVAPVVNNGIAHVDLMHEVNGKVNETIFRKEATYLPQATIVNYLEPPAEEEQTTRHCQTIPVTMRCDI